MTHNFWAKFGNFGYSEFYAFRSGYSLCRNISMDMSGFIDDCRRKAQLGKKTYEFDFEFLHYVPRSHKLFNP